MITNDCAIALLCAVTVSPQNRG